MKTIARNRGASLIEVLVAVVIIAVGLLGVAKMQALAMAATRGSSTRSLISIEAASLASAMHANRAYWNAVSTTTTTFSANVANGAITASTDAALPTQNSDCATVVCTKTALAAYDLVGWSTAINAVTPGSTGTVMCSGAPVACTITVSWTENMVGMNANTQNVAAQQTQTLQYSLLVEPGA